MLLRSPRALACALVLAAALGGAQAGAAPFEDPALATRVTVLDNGLTVLTLEDPTTPVVSWQLWVKVGAGDEARYTGLAHLFEHMMFRGSKNLPPEAHGSLIQERGGRVNAFTSLDVTVYFADVTREHLPLVVELEAERLRHLDISEGSLASEREVVLEERRMRTEDDPQGRAFEALMALSFQAHPYRVPTIGWRSDIEAVDVATSMRFFEHYYGADNLVVSVAGDIDAEEVLALVRRHLGGLRRSDEIPRNPTLEPVQRGERRAELHFDVQAPLVAAAWHAPEAGHADGPALDVLSEILSSGRTSRLHRRLVYEEEEALYAWGGSWDLQRAGVFFAFAGVRPDRSVARTEALLFEEIDRLAREPVTEQELEKARRSIEVSLISRLRTAHALASRNGRDMVTFGRIRPLDERLAAIRDVSAADVQRVARTYLRPERRSVVTVVPPPPEGAWP